VHVSTEHVHMLYIYVLFLMQELLGEMHSSGKLTSLSLWKELFPLIDKDNRYHDMLGQPGKGITGILG